MLDLAARLWHLGQTSDRPLPYSKKRMLYRLMTNLSKELALLWDMEPEKAKKKLYNEFKKRIEIPEPEED